MLPHELTRRSRGRTPRCSWPARCAITSAAANVVTIAAGPIVFSEPLPDGTLSLVARLVGFTAVIAGAVLTPGPEVEEAPPPAPAPEPAPA